MSKKLMWQIFSLVALCSIFIWAINNPGIIFSSLGAVLKVAYPLLLGCVIAFIINLPMKQLELWFDKIFSRLKKPVSKKIKRPVSLALATVFIIGAFLALIFIIVPQFVKIISSFLTLLPGYLKTFEGYLENLQDLFAKIYITLPEFDFNAEKILSTFDYFSKTGQAFVDNTINVTTSLFSGIFNFFLAFTFSIYLLLDKEKVLALLKKSVYAFFPKSCADYIENVVNKTDRAFSKFITGQLTEAVILGVLCYIGMIILRLPQAALISIIVAVTALIPVFGAWIGAFLGALIIVLTKPIGAIWFLIFLSLLQQFETNIIYPRVVGKSVGLPGVLVLASVTLGGNLFGIVGMLFAVPIVSVLFSIYTETVDLLYNKKNNS